MPNVWKMLKPSRDGDTAVDWPALKKEIVGKLDVEAEYASMGVEFTGFVRTSGWRECRAVGRPDKKPSAAVNVLSGVYKCSGEAPEILPFFDFAAKYQPVLGDWLGVIEHYADKVGATLPFAPKVANKGRVEAEYDYTDSAGELLYQVVRYRKDDGKKSFGQRRPDPQGGWIDNIKGVTFVPYRLVEIASAPEETVIVVEGEKDADRLTAEGFVATTAPGGAGNAKVWAALAPHLADRNVLVIADNDKPGRDYARAACGHLAPHAKSIKILDLPGLPEKGDVSDYLDAVGTPEELGRLIHAAPDWTPELTSDPLDEDATAADLIAMNSTIRWLWDEWIPIGVLTILAAEPGCGKTRLCADLLRRIHLGLPWPDGKPSTLPAGSKALWIPADNQHPELGSFPTSFGFPGEALVLNATRRNPYTGTMLDSPEDLEDFEARIVRVKPAFVFIDTSLNATDRSSHKPEDAKAFFKPLQEIAARTQTAIICVTHLNASGKPLGRRITGQGRVVIQLDRPDPDGQPLRRKLCVTKSNSMFPAALGVTMGDAGNEYDDAPPIAPDPEAAQGRGGKAAAPTKLKECMAWLTDTLSGGPLRVKAIRDQAEEQGFLPPTLYAAKDKLGVEQTGAKGHLQWELTTIRDDDAPDF